MGRTTGRRPDFGRLQLSRALYPAVDENQDKVTEKMESAIDRVADHFERGR